jgi:DNA-binding CsgD family transcriptional regulator
MRNQLNSSAFYSALKDREDLNVIGRFSIQNHNYLIILLNGDHADNASPEAANLIEISRFQANGQLCAICAIDCDDVKHPEPAAPEPNLASLLTERELQIATLIASGKPNKQIASHLHISEWTVATYLRRIFVKLGVDSRAAMVYRCAALIQQIGELGKE